MISGGKHTSCDNTVQKRSTSIVCTVWYGMARMSRMTKPNSALLAGKRAKTFISRHVVGVSRIIEPWR